MTDTGPSRFADGQGAVRRQPRSFFAFCGPYLLDWHKLCFLPGNTSRESTVSNSISSFLGIHGDALPLREQRMKLIASNLSNVDTPGYKAKDMDFEAALKSAEGVRDGSLMQTTDAKHYEIGNSGGLNPFQITRESDQPSLDGNTVDADAERAAYGRAALEYRASLSFLESKVRSMLTAITGQ
ncbi:flagellar basal-body rod protein FlgB [Xanthomonas hortorum ATCC 19865]|nr:flagellar basal-body rod protein FlgB [Xanthomonas hortorum ATCC 19865]